MSKFRDRKFAFLLYPEDKSHKKALETLIKSYDIAYILHDKDLDENGEIKKAHYHVVIKISDKNAIWSTAICKKIGIEENYIQEIKKLDNMLLYLIHYNDSDKFQYDISEVKGNLVNRIKILINKDDKLEGEKVIEIIELIDNSDILKMKDLALYCAENGYWSEFRRGASIFSQILYEHNNDIMEIKKQ